MEVKMSRLVLQLMLAVTVASQQSLIEEMPNVLASGVHLLYAEQLCKVAFNRYYHMMFANFVA